MLQFRVPASTTNLGHGFDCLGIALGAANTIAVTPTGDHTISAPQAPDDGLARMAGAISDACEKAWDITLPGFIVRVSGDVPLSRGMGSSSTVILGVAAACQRMANRPLNKHELVTIAAEVEGHPDNVAASCFGGFTIAAEIMKETATELRVHRFAVPSDFVAVLAIPPYEVKTSEARRILPQQFTRQEGVRSLQRSALITALIASGDIEGLRGLFTDAWHENYRAQLNPGLIPCRAASEKAGAIGTILSGSGSTILSFSRITTANAVAAAMKKAFSELNTIADVRILPFDNDGLKAVG
jgi:homoserine kinase